MFSRGYRGTTAKPSLLGFGCMRLPRVSEESQEIDFEKAERLIDEAYAAGVNYYDTAYVYHDGKSEGFLKRALAKYPRESYFLADKMPSWHLKMPGDVERIFEEQLKRCGVDYFDFYLCHSITAKSLETFEKFDVFTYLEHQKEKGRIRRLGFSFHDTPEVLEKVLSLRNWDFAQIQLNYIDWLAQDAKGQYTLLQNAGIPVVVMEPVRGGALATLCPEAAACFKQAEPDKSLASWALRFAGSLPGVMTVLSGMNTLEQVRENTALFTAFTPLSDEEQKTIEKAAELYKAHLTIPCTGCRYCMDCPSGVEIPKMFALYNDYTLSQREGVYLKAYEALPETQRAASCVQCGRCAERCPQHIQIPEKMQEIKACIEKLQAD